MDFSFLGEDFYCTRSLNNARSLVVMGPGDLRMGKGWAADLLNLQFVPEKFSNSVLATVPIRVIPTTLKYHYPGLLNDVQNISDVSDFVFVHESGRGGYYEILIRGVIYHVPCAHIDVISSLVVAERGGSGNMFALPKEFYIVKKVSSIYKEIVLIATDKVNDPICGGSDVPFSFPFSVIGDVTNRGFGNKFMMGSCFVDGIVEFGYDGCKIEIPLIRGEHLILAMNNDNKWTILDVISFRRQFLLSILFAHYSFDNSGTEITYGVSFQFVVNHPVDFFAVNTRMCETSCVRFDNNESLTFVDVANLQIPEGSLVVSAVFPQQLPAPFVRNCDFPRIAAIFVTPEVDAFSNLREKMSEITANQRPALREYLKITFPYSFKNLMRYIVEKMNTVISDREFFKTCKIISHYDKDNSDLRLVANIADSFSKTDMALNKTWEVLVNILCDDIKIFEAIGRCLKAVKNYNFSLSGGYGSRLMYPYYIPMSNSTVDIVTCIEGLSSVRHPLLVMYEIFRVLKPGGKILIREHTIENNFELTMLRWEKFISGKRCVTYCTMKEWCSMLCFIGFVDISVVKMSPVSRFLHVRAVRGGDNQFAKLLRQPEPFVNIVPPATEIVEGALPQDQTVNYRISYDPPPVEDAPCPDCLEKRQDRKMPDNSDTDDWDPDFTRVVHKPIPKTFSEILAEARNFDKYDEILEDMDLHLRQPVPDGYGNYDSIAIQNLRHGKPPDNIKNGAEIPMSQEKNSFG